jgi:RNA polymerase sigma-70 factor (ECF subfamily)
MASTNALVDDDAGLTRSARRPPLYGEDSARERATPGLSSRTDVQRPDHAPPDTVILAAARGDRAAAETLLATLLPRMRNLIRYIVRRDHDVDDITQEAVIALLKGLATYRGHGAFVAWADRVVVRATFAVLRKRRQEPHLVLLEPHTLPAAWAPAGDDYLLRRRAVAALDNLPVDQRLAFVLHHVLEMSVPEVAEELGIPFETVRSRLRLARARLRELGWSATEGLAAAAAAREGTA